MAQPHSKSEEPSQGEQSDHEQRGIRGQVIGERTWSLTPVKVPGKFFVRHEIYKMNQATIECVSCHDRTCTNQLRLDSCQWAKERSQGPYHPQQSWPAAAATATRSTKKLQLRLAAVGWWLVVMVRRVVRVKVRLVGLEWPAVAMDLRAHLTYFSSGILCLSQIHNSYSGIECCQVVVVFLSTWLPSTINAGRKLSSSSLDVLRNKKSGEFPTTATTHWGVFYFILMYHSS